MMDNGGSLQVRKNDERSRYELIVGGRVAGIANYRAQGNRIVFPHTEILPDLRGRGLGAVLVRGALDDVRGTDKTVVPACWFVAEFIEQNPEYQALLTA